MNLFIPSLSVSNAATHQTYFVLRQHTACSSSCMHSYLSAVPVQQKNTVCVLYIAYSYCSMYSVMVMVRVLLIFWFIVTCLQHLRLYRRYMKMLGQSAGVIPEFQNKDKSSYQLIYVGKQLLLQLLSSDICPLSFRP